MQHAQNSFNVLLEWGKGSTYHPFFSLYVNDLMEFFLFSNVKGLSCLSEKTWKIAQYLSTFFVLLDTDDTALLSEDPDDFQ